MEIKSNVRSFLISISFVWEPDLMFDLLSTLLNRVELMQYPDLYNPAVVSTY